MGKETGFLEYKRQDNPYVDVGVRIKSFDELHEFLPEDERRTQAAICMNCGVPFCQSGMTLSGMVTGCPLHNLIPEWNDEIYQGNYAHAYERLIKINPFPEFTGRVCPALCEKACMCGQYDTPVAIRDNELFLSEKAFECGYLKGNKERKRSQSKVAVIGSGPSGLAAAYTLNKRGHSVVVYEREDEIGGLLMYGIPNMKLDKSVILRRKKLLEEDGIEFRTGVNIGKDISRGQLEDEYDAIVMCCGSKKPRSVDVAMPDSAKGIFYAVDYLGTQTKALKAGKPVNEEYSAKGKNVVIIGGGDTGNDCIGTSIRQGAKSVTAIEMMPKPPKERVKDNPWPEWPKVEKIDYGHEEAIYLFGHDVRIYSSTITGIKTDKDGRLKSVLIAGVSFKEGKLIIDEKSTREYPCELLLIAAGFVGCEDYVADAFKLKRSERGSVLTDDGGYHTGKGKVFCAGDMRRGQSLVVWAIAEGIECGYEVDKYLIYNR